MKFASIVASIENLFDRAKQAFTINVGIADPIMIQPYIGFGTPERFTIRARVLEDDGITEATVDDSVWRNIRNTYRFLESDELVGAVIEASCLGMVQTAVSDEEGFVTFTFEPAPQTAVPAGVVTLPVAFRILEAPGRFTEGIVIEEQVLISSPAATFGIISDIDDTILKSDATNYIDALKWMFLYNAQTRLPFEGVASFYKQLVQDKNPIFYVSSSPWNLYAMLVDFMIARDIPLGPLFLKDYGISKDQLLTKGHSGHKLEQIETILTTYPDLNFILIGDSGQKDPEIYREVVERWNGRILAIYIRDVSADKRDDEVTQITAALAQQHQIDMLLVPHSDAAAQHAAQNGWV